MKKGNRKKTIRIKGGVMLPHNVPKNDDLALFNKMVFVKNKNNNEPRDRHGGNP